MTPDQIPDYLLNTLYFILVLGVAVVIHEAGHFIAARLSGIRVEKFSVGFGKALFSFKRGETEYILAPIPMGGYVKLAGDNPAEITGRQDEFYSISPWRRIPTIVAGPLANVVGAFAIFFALAFLFGKAYDQNVVGKVIPGSLEDEAGLRKNDVILSVNGANVEDWEDYLTATNKAREAHQESVEIGIKRAEEVLKVTLPLYSEERDNRMVLSLVDPAGPGFGAGLRSGDRILSIDGKAPESWAAFRRVAQNLTETKPEGMAARTVSVSWRTPAGEVKSASVTPSIIKNESGEYVTLMGLGAAALGISPKVIPRVAASVRGFPAADLDLRPGAEILAINGEMVDNVDDLQEQIAFSYTIPEGQSVEEAKPVPFELTWRNPDEQEIQSAKVTPKIEVTYMPSEIGLQSAKQVAIAQLGVTFEESSRELGLIESLQEGVTGTIGACVETFMVLKGLVTRRVNHKVLGGPVAIFQLSARIGKEGLRKLFWFCAMLQANLALLNLLPIPVLDGGHLVVALSEGVSRRTFSLKTREAIQWVGLAILLPLFAFVFYNDFDRLGLFDWIKELVS
ncbi:MAG: RIP metalloprotease RseP [Candidatus Omnitrophica bacterium]|nr:hypothetical protein [bacterium]NUN97336.1 RIP metalloprotease RseP [Candidatus Omnitrophota bacterium]